MLLGILCCHGFVTLKWCLLVSCVPAVCTDIPASFSVKTADSYNFSNIIIQYVFVRYCYKRRVSLRDVVQKELKEVLVLGDFNVNYLDKNQ